MPKDHTCRDLGYSPHVKPCAACLSQLSKNGAELTKAKRERGRFSRVAGSQYYGVTTVIARNGRP